MAHKTEKFKITGISYCKDDIIANLAVENDDYSLSKRELLEEYSEGDKIFEYEFDTTPLELVPEPENEFDSNAIKVMVNGIKVGYIKKGSTAHLKNLLDSPDFSGKSIEIYGGKFKEIDDDDNIVNDEMDIYADLEIYTRIESPAASVNQKSDKIENKEFQKPKKNYSKLFIIEIIVGILIFLFGLIDKSVLLSILGIFIFAISFTGYKKNKK